MNVLSFQDAMRSAGNPGTKHLLLGNGFSISLRPDIFTYGALLDSADFGTAPYITALFDKLKTQDFELVIKTLIDAAKVVEIYQPSAISLIDQLKADAELVKSALVTAIARRHPDRPNDISVAQYIACRSFLSQFRHIYTLNYDVLLYWTMMQNEIDQISLMHDDGFRHPDSVGQPYVSWQQAQSATVHYLHGALHLFDHGTEIIKYTWSKTDIPIVDQVRKALDEEKYPLFVAEGTSTSKYEKIMHNAYLHKSLRSLEACCDNFSACIVVFGHSLADNDQHVLRCIATGKAPNMLVSVYGDPTSLGNRLIEDNVNSLIAYRASVRNRYPLRVIFYDAASAHVWG